MPYSDYLCNRMIDFLWRGQAFAPPGTVYVALMTAAPAKAGGGTEVAAGVGYARVAVARSLDAWSGTQGAGTVIASTGSSGESSNNQVITYGVPTGDWGRVVGMAVYDAAAGGNLLAFDDLTDAKNINAGDAAPSFPAGALINRLT